MLKKNIQFVATSNVASVYSQEDILYFTTTILSLLEQYPYDMFVFEKQNDDAMRIRLAGYNLITREFDEETVVLEENKSLIEKLWFKIDDYDSHYVGTFLLPGDY